MCYPYRRVGKWVIHFSTNQMQMKYSEKEIGGISSNKFSLRWALSHSIPKDAQIKAKQLRILVHMCQPFYNNKKYGSWLQIPNSNSKSYAYNMFPKRLRAGT